MAKGNNFKIEENVKKYSLGKTAGLIACYSCGAIAGLACLGISVLRFIALFEVLKKK